MSIFHLTVKRGSRSENRLSVDKHDYIMRLERFAERHDGDLAFGESGNMPSWAADVPRKFWVEADEHERANGTLYHEVEFALPRELTFDQQISAAREAAQMICGDQHPYSWGLHEKEGNPHVHLMFSGRMLDGIDRDADQFFKRYNAKNPERGGCRKESSGDARGPEWVKQVRADWQDVANRHLAAAGLDDRIDHRSHKDRGLDEAPGVHLGRRVTRLEMRGKSTWRGNKNRGAAHLNASLRVIKSQLKEKEHGQQHHGRKLHSVPVPGALPGHRDGSHRQDGNHRLGGGDGGGPEAIYAVESLDRRQLYKARILQQQYQQEIQTALAARLAYVDRQPDRIAITLKGGGGVTDHGDRLLTKAGRGREILAALALAKTKGWKQIQITGTEAFKARAYVEAVRAGLAVVGYEPTPELRAQLEKEKSMSDQAGVGGMMALTPDVTVGQAKPASRWLDPLRAAREKLEAERKAAKEKLATLPETDIKKVEQELAVALGGTMYLEARRKFKEAAKAAKDAGALTRNRAEAKKEEAWQALLALHAKALAEPGAAKHLAYVSQKNQEREQLTVALIPMQLGIGEIEYLEREIQKGRDLEAEFRQAWTRRKLQPLKLWQELAIAPVFEAEAAQERARLQAEADAANQVKHIQRNEQIQREINAQQQADAIQDQLGKPGLTAEQEEALERQRRYYLALADGHDEEEAKERAAKKSDALRL